MTEKLKKEEEQKDFTERLVKPHRKISREVTEKDMERVMEEAHVLYNICYSQVGRYPGAHAMAHSQIDNKDPLRFFVTVDKEIIINPVITNHTKVTVDHLEGCISFPDREQVTVQRWHKCEMEYQTLGPDGKFGDKVKRNLSGMDAYIAEHEIDHLNAIFVYDNQPEDAMKAVARKKVQDKSKEIGRCVCSMPLKAFTCPCKFFIDQDCCHCSGEKHEGISQEEWVKYNLK